MSLDSKKAIELMKKVLKTYDIKMSIQGCGCCGSPDIVFEYKGDTIVKGEHINIDMFEE